MPSLILDLSSNKTVPCEVFVRLGNQYQVSYVDPDSGETKTEFFPKDRVIFPDLKTSILGA